MEPLDKLASLQGMPVVAFDEGLRLGRVHDVFIDRQAKRIQGVSFRSGLWRKEKDAYVALADILKIGHDVVIIASQTAAVPLNEDMTPNSLRHLKGFKVTTRDGAWLGEVADLNVNRENGTISEIILRDETMLEVDAEDIVLGPDVVVVPADYADRVTRPETARKGLLGRMVDPTAVSDSLRGTYEDIKASVSGGKGTEKMFDTLRTGSAKTRETVKRTSRKIQETLEQLRRKSGPDAAENIAADEGYQGTEAEHAGRTHSEGGASDTAMPSDRDAFAAGSDSDRKPMAPNGTDETA